MPTLLFQACSWTTRNLNTRDGLFYYITAYGRTSEGESVCLTIADHRPWFYVRTTDEEKVRRYLDKGLYTEWRSGEKTTVSYDSSWLLRMEEVDRHLLYGFRNGERTSMLKLTCANETVMRQMIKAVQDGGLRTCNGNLSNFNPLNAFFWKHEIKPCGWLSVDYVSANVVTSGSFRSPRSFCDVDLQVGVAAVRPHASMEMAPFRIMSFDIEQNGIPMLQESKHADEVLCDESPTDAASGVEVDMEDGVEVGAEEVVGEEKFSFPDSEDPVCEITTICLRSFRHGQSGVEVHCFTYKPVVEEEIVSKVQGVQDVQRVVLHQGEGEKDMLRRFVDYLNESQHDINLGWNTIGFDWQAIYLRCKMHGVSLRRVGKVELWSEPYLRTIKSSTQSRGNTEIKIFEMPGVIHHDLLRIWREDHKERSYSLESVSSAHLGEHKLPIEPNQITSWAKSADPMEFTKVVVYCIQDTALPDRLSKRFRKLLNLFMFCNVAQILPNEFIQRGSNVRTMSLIGARLERKGIVSEDVQHPFNRSWRKYEGACVLNPQRGYHKEPIATLDFAGLYPACINSFYIDYMRWVEKDGSYDNLPGVHYEDVEWVDKVWDNDKKRYNCEHVSQRYVVGGGYPDLMPTLMTELRTERKAAKKKVKQYLQLAEEHAGTAQADEYSTQAGVWDANQLAVKLLMNAGYGFLGTPVSPLAHRGLAMCVTRYGRFMLEQAMRYTLARYGVFDDVAVSPDERTEEEIHQIAQGRSLERLQTDAKAVSIVYGDTDSVMVKWELPEHLRAKLDGDSAEQNEVLRWVFKRAAEASKGASHYIVRYFCHDVVWDGDKIVSCTMDLEFEKVFYPSHFYQKKRYGYGIIADKPDVATRKVKAQGMAMVRRDISKMARELLWDCTKAYLTRDNEAIVTRLTSTFETLVEMAKHIGDPEKIDLCELEVNQQLAMSYKKTLPPHAVVAEKLKAPSRGENPMPGDRIGYVPIIDHPNAKKSNKVDSVKWILKEKLPVDILQIATDMLIVLQQIIPEDSGIVVRDIVKHLVQQIDVYQAPHASITHQQKTNNQSLTQWIPVNPNAKRKSPDAVVAAVAKKARKDAQKARGNVPSGMHGAMDRFLKPK